MIHYEEDWAHPGSICSLLFGFDGSVLPRASIFALASALIALGLCLLDDELDYRTKATVEDLSGSQVWTAVTAVIGILLSFRTKQALGRFWEGTGLLHQMRGEWFDAVSCLMAFSRKARKDRQAEVDEFRHTLVRLTSLMHGCALHEIKDIAQEQFEVLDHRGLDDDTLLYLSWCRKQGFNLVEVALHMIQVLVTENHENNILAIAPPILSRVYQELSRGMVNLHNAKKITDTQFPFPYAQLISCLLLVHLFLTPFVVSAFVQNHWWSAMITFVPVFGMFSVNSVATELEMPFGDDDNDLNMKHFQTEMNNSLLMLIHSKADHCPRTSPLAAKTYDQLELKATMVDVEHVVKQMRDPNAQGSINGEPSSVLRAFWKSQVETPGGDLTADAPEEEPSGDGGKTSWVSALPGV